MDPDACLDELLDLVGKLDSDAMGDPDADDMLARIQELTMALDGWLMKGGALPKRWTTQRIRCTAHLVTMSTPAIQCMLYEGHPGDHQWRN